MWIGIIILGLVVAFFLISFIVSLIQDHNNITLKINPLNYDYRILKSDNDGEIQGKSDITKCGSNADCPEGYICVNGMCTPEFKYKIQCRYKNEEQWTDMYWVNNDNPKLFPKQYYRNFHHRIMGVAQGVDEENIKNHLAKYLDWIKTCDLEDCRFDNPNMGVDESENIFLVASVKTKTEKEDIMDLAETEEEVELFKSIKKYTENGRS